MAVFTRQDWEWLPIEPSKLSRSSAVSIIVDSCSSRIRLALGEINIGDSVWLLLLLVVVVVLLCMDAMPPLLSITLAEEEAAAVVPLEPFDDACCCMITFGSSVLMTFFISIVPPGPTVELETSTTPDTLLLPTLVRLGDASKPTADPDGEI
uniref:Uncharacterized protein n=1 Tax=Anopheles melas TaxID=34690 RepID=A0A182U6A6_9DIPT